MALKDGLISYFSLEENAANTTITDKKAVTTGAASTNTSNLSIAGKIANAFDFDGATEYATLTNNASINFGDVDFSISCWIKADSHEAYEGFLAKASDYATQKIQYGFIFDGEADLNFVTGDQTDVNWCGNVAINNGTWYHIVGVYDAVNSKSHIYVNNNKTSNEALSLNVAANACDLYGGCFFNGSGLFDGIIDEVGIWNRALSDAEVSSLYNGGSGLSYADINPTTKPITPFISSAAVICSGAVV